MAFSPFRTRRKLYSAVWSEDLGGGSNKLIVREAPLEVNRIVADFGQQTRYKRALLLQDLRLGNGSTNLLSIAETERASPTLGSGQGLLLSATKRAAPYFRRVSGHERHPKS